jgi:hypothetical protein
MEHEGPNATLTALEEEQEPLLRWMETIRVTNPEERRNAENLLISARIALKQAHDKRMELTRPLDQAKANIIDLFRPYVDRLSLGIAALQAELTRYHAYLIQIQQAQEATALALAAHRMAEAQETGEILEPPEPPDVPLVPRTSYANLGSVTYREDFDIRIVEPALVPRDLCEPSMAKIRARVKSGVTSIPGVLVSRKHTTVTRGGK